MVRTRTFLLRSWVRTAIVTVLLVGLFLMLLPLSWRLADPLFTHRYDPRFPVSVLLVFPDRVEIKTTDRITDISPRPVNAGFTFLVPLQRQSSIERQIGELPTPRQGSFWKLHVQSLSSDRQRIELQLVRDGLYGSVYDATANKIVPVATRRAGPGAAFIVMFINLLLWLVLSFTGAAGLRTLASRLRIIQPQLRD